MTDSPEKNSTGSGSESFSAHDEQVVAALEQICSAMEAGRPLDRQRILEEFPDVADELQKCFDGLRIIHDVAPPIDAVAHSSPDLEDSEQVGAQALGDFRILRQLGRGGMGVVYEAVQQSLDRHIALKVLPFASLLDNRQLQRFKNEVRAAAILKHPNIVSVYQTGCQRGVHYYAMELVEGQNLAELIEQLRDSHGSLRGEPAHGAGQDGGVVAANERTGNLSPSGSPTQSSTAAPEAAVAGQQSETPTQPVAEISTEYAGDRTNFFRSVARIGIQAAEALEYAHQMGVVHRDIKPSNLMLDRDGRVCLTDFGLAATRSDASLTQTGDLLGTARYMSPEQASSQHAIMDHRTDIYSLGVTIYELLTLSPAFSADDPRHILRRIEEDQPKAPRALDASIPKDLETIILKATSKDRDARYATAQHFADDLRRFLQHQPVTARRTGPVERLWRWIKRNRSLASFMLATACLLTVVAIAGPLIAWRQSVLKRQAISLNESLRHHLYDAQMIAAHAALERGDAERADALLRKYITEDESHDLRSFEWYYLWRLSRRAVESPSFRNWTTVLCVDFSPDGGAVASADWNGQVFLRDVNTRRDLWASAPGTGHRGAVSELHFGPHGQMIATADIEQVLLWNVETGKVLTRLGPFSSEVATITFSHDRRLLAVGLEVAGDASSMDSTIVQLYRVEGPDDGDLSRTRLSFSSFLTGYQGRVEALSFSSDGEMLAAGGTDHVRLWRVADGEAVREAPFARDGVVRTARFSPTQPNVLALGIGNPPTDSSWGEVRVWDLRENELLVVKRMGAPVHELTFSKDGERLAAADEQRTIRVWNASAPYARIDTVRGHSARVNGIALSVDGSMLASAGSDNKLVLWDVPRQREVDSIEAHDAGVAHVDFNSDGSMIASGGGDRVARLFDTSTGKPLRTLETSVREVLSVDISPDDSTVAVAAGMWPETTPGELRLWNIIDGSVKHTLYQGPDMVWSAQFSPDGRQIAAAFDRTESNNPDKTGTLAIWDVQSGRPVRKFVVRPARHIRQLAWSPDGTHIATISMHRNETSQHGPVQLWNCETGTCETVFENPDGDLYVSLAYSKDDQTIAVGGWDGTIYLWPAHRETPADRRGRVLTGHAGAVLCLDFSPDGRRLVSSSADGTARVWNVVTGAAELVFRESTWIYCARFSHDGRALAIGTSHAKAKIRLFRAHDRDVTFDPDVKRPGLQN